MRLAEELRHTRAALTESTRENGSLRFVSSQLHDQVQALRAQVSDQRAALQVQVQQVRGEGTTVRGKCWGEGEGQAEGMTDQRAARKVQVGGKGGERQGGKCYRALGEAVGQRPKSCTAGRTGGGGGLRKGGEVQGRLGAVE